MEAIIAIALTLITTACSIGLVVGSILLIVHGFKKDTTWGVINLLVPFGAIVFMFKYPDEAEPGRKITLISLIGLIATIALTGIIGSTV